MHHCKVLTFFLLGYQRSMQVLIIVYRPPNVCGGSVTILFVVHLYKPGTSVIKVTSYASTTCVKTEELDNDIDMNALLSLLWYK